MLFYDAGVICTANGRLRGALEILPKNGSALEKSVEVRGITKELGSLGIYRGCLS